MLQIQRKLPMMKLDIKNCDTYWMKKMMSIIIILSSLSLVVSSHSAKYSSPLNSPESDDEFKPMVFTHYDSEHIARHQFTEIGKYPAFKPISSNLRFSRNQFPEQIAKKEYPTVPTSSSSPPSRETEVLTSGNNTNSDDSLEETFEKEIRSIETLITSYLTELFETKEVNVSGISVKINENPELEKNNTDSNDENSLESNVKRFVRSAVVSVSLPRAAETGRLFFFSGLKKILWPIFIGIQVVKSLLFALFLPSIIGSLGKIATQGSASIAGFNRPSETVNDLNFKDNFEEDNKFSVMDNGYAYNQPEASVNHFSTQLYDAASINNNALSRFGLTDQKDAINGLGYEENKKTKLNSMPLSLAEVYEAFKKVPVSSQILSNYDPFYSPILSRLDSVFEQLGLKSNNESCREKLVCSIYADPMKYAPYSNLVSVQLSREIDELHKPVSDSPEILRFFKYMRAAKDGQDGESCKEIYPDCTEFDDVKSPPLIDVYNNINKLVEARKINK